MRPDQGEIVVILGESQWPHAAMLSRMLPGDTPVIRARTAAEALAGAARHMPCRVVLLVPPDVSQTLALLDLLKRRFDVQATVVDASDDERVERFCRLAGCGEYYPASVRAAAPPCDRRAHDEPAVTSQDGARQPNAMLHHGGAS